jgi:hypothetical protein
VALSRHPERVSIVLSGELRARVRRCGCQGLKGPQLTEVVFHTCCRGKVKQQEETVVLPDPGGLPERSSFLRRLRATGTPVVTLDAGDLLFPSFDPRPWEKAEWSRRAELLVESQHILGLDAYVPGELDLALGREQFERLLARAPFPVLAANLVDAGTRKPLFPGRATVRRGGVTIGVVGLFGRPDADDPQRLARESLLATDPVEAARAEVKALRADGVDLVVLVAHVGEPRLREIARSVEGIDVALGVHAEETTTLELPVEGRTLIGRIPARGGGLLLEADVKLVPGGRGIVDEDQMIKTRAWLARLRKDLSAETSRRAGANTADVAAIDSQIDYTSTEIARLEAQVPRDTRHLATMRAPFLDARAERVGQSPELIGAIDRYKSDSERAALDPALVASLEAPGRAADGSPVGFVTAQACASCHPKQAEVWSKTRHAHAWQTLESANNQRDPECVRCHSIGFREPGGFAEATRVSSRLDSSGTAIDMRNVQCEACHGPRLGHPQRPGIGIRRPAMNDCMRCHDPERDPGFTKRFPEMVKKVCCGSSSN